VSEWKVSKVRRRSPGALATAATAAAAAAAAAAVGFQPPHGLAGPVEAEQYAGAAAL
jgi:hypothetical protein